jgi:hypothetical protein
MSYLPVDAIVSELCIIALTANVLTATLGKQYCGRLSRNRPSGNNRDCAHPLEQEHCWDPIADLKSFVDQVNTHFDVKVRLAGLQWFQDKPWALVNGSAKDLNHIISLQEIRAFHRSFRVCKLGSCF